VNVAIVALPIPDFLFPLADSSFNKFLLVALVVTAPCMATANADAATLHGNAVAIRAALSPL